jgi:hypothetical protein
MTYSKAVIKWLNHPARQSIFESSAGEIFNQAIIYRIQLQTATLEKPKE